MNRKEKLASLLSDFWMEFNLATRESGLMIEDQMRESGEMADILRNAASTIQNLREVPDPPPLEPTEREKLTKSFPVGDFPF